jgi:predicted DNA-binding transcriptional regulator YafY
MAETSARLLRLLSLLQSRPSWSGPALAERLGVTDRTIRRDVERLRQLGYPVDGATGVTGGYRLSPGASLPPLLLDDDEAVAVAIGLRTATTAVAGVGEAAVAALVKLERVLPARLRTQVNAVGTATVQLAQPAEEIDSALLVTVAQACRGAERLRFAYRDRVDRQSERTVEPYRLVFTGRRWYLVARDVRREAWRTFRVDRMAEVIATGHRFVLDDPPDAAGLVSMGMAVAPYRYQARLLIHAPADEVARRVPPTVGVIEAADAPDQCVLVTGSDDLDSIAAHVMSLGFDFRILAPVELRDRAKVLARRLRDAAAGR